MIDPIAAELARTPQLCALHVAGPDWRCLGCRSAVRLAPRWPCLIASLAQFADR